MSVYDNKNPYVVNDPYEKNNNDSSKIQEKQFKIQDENSARRAIASVFEKVVSKSENEIDDLRIEIEEFEEITNYYNKYYGSEVVGNGILLSFFALILSFFSFFGAFVFIILIVLISANHQMVYFQLFSRNIKVDKKFHEIIFKKLFPNTLKLKSIIFINLVFLFFAMVAYQFPINLDVFSTYYEIDFFKYLHEKFNFKFEYFIFAIINFVNNIFTTSLKVVERWSL